MATAQIVIKNAAGQVIFDLSKRITRNTASFIRTAPQGSLVGPEIIRLGTAADRQRYWCFTRFLKTVYKNGTEYAPIPAFSVFITTRSELENSAAPQYVKNNLAGNMDYNSTYLCILDARGSTEFGTNDAVIDVGMF